MAKRPSKPTAKPAAKPSRAVAPPPEPLAPAVPHHPVPKPLAAIVGQPRALAAIESAVRSRRVHHAWIFHGPRGVGKMTAALAFASLVLDPSTAPDLSGNLAADPGSPVQRLIRAGSHPDLHVITKELARFSEDKKIRDAKLITIPKDVIDAHLLQPASLAASVRNDAPISKVFIVDEAELLDRSPTNAPTQNALLKTMEEPPERTLIILVTSSVDSLLPTIRSRCQSVPFAPLDDRAMREWLKAEHPVMDAPRRDWLLGFAAGAPGVFLLAHEHGVFDWHTRLAPLLAKTEKGDFAPELAPALADLIESWAEQWVKSHDNASKEAANRAGAAWVLRLLGEHWRAGLRERIRADGDATPYLRAIQLLSEAQRFLDANIGAPFVAESLSAETSAAFEEARS